MSAGVVITWQLRIPGGTCDQH